MLIFKEALKNAEKWLKQKNLELKKIRDFYKLERDKVIHEHAEVVKNSQKLKDEIKQAKKIKEKLAAEAYLILVKTGKIASSKEDASTETADVKKEGENHKNEAFEPNLESIDAHAIDLVFKLIS